MVKVTIEDINETAVSEGEITPCFTMTDSDDGRGTECMTNFMGNGNVAKVVTTVMKAMVQVVNNNTEGGFERGIIHMLMLKSLKDALTDDDDDDTDEDDEAEDTADEVYETSSPKPGAKKFHRGRRV